MLEEKIKDILERTFDYRGSFSYMVQGDIHDMDGKLTILVEFENRRRVIKIPRSDPRTCEYIQKEYSILSYLKEHKFMDLNPLMDKKTNSLMMDFIKGESLVYEYRRKKDWNIFLKGIDWIAGFHGLSNGGGKIGFTHGDYAPIQVISRDNELFVIDWEYFQPKGEQFFDVLRYARVAAESIFGEQFLEGAVYSERNFIEKLFSKNNPLTEMIRHYAKLRNTSTNSILSSLPVYYDHIIDKHTNSTSEDDYYIPVLKDAKKFCSERLLS